MARSISIKMQQNLMMDYEGEEQVQEKKSDV
jgi:hypothetical protein